MTYLNYELAANDELFVEDEFEDVGRNDFV